ncbi:MAG: S4 domain-containing protein YaaA [Candidatus Izemoplasmatales bacterium]|nr:S4 domain-containing protein YaaA [Candidatus Izemoplasmatales bacterium]
MKKIQINTPFITLGQFLKYVDLVQSGGEVKAFLAVNDIKVNGEIENRRGKKLRPNDIVVVNKNREFLISE